MVISVAVISVALVLSILNFSITCAVTASSKDMVEVIAANANNAKKTLQRINNHLAFVKTH